MSSFWEGVIAGYGIAIPVGAIAILIVDTSLRQGFGSGFMAGAGAASADMIYAVLAVLGGAALAALFIPYATILALISAAVLLGLGGYGLTRAYRLAQRDKDVLSVQRSDVVHLANPGHIRIYIRFLGLTLLNPLTIAYFGALIIGRDVSSTPKMLDNVAFVIGAFLASLSWQSFLAWIGAVAGRYLSTKFQLYATIGGNLVVLLLGLRILISLFQF